MKKIFIFLSFYLLLLTILLSCNSKYVIRDGVEGYIYSNETKLPLDKVEIGFLIDPANPENSNLEGSYYSNKKGWFIIPAVIVNTSYREGRFKQLRRKPYLKIKKKGFEESIIDIRDSIYRRTNNGFLHVKGEKTIIYVDTIYMKSIKN